MIFILILFIVILSPMYSPGNTAVLANMEPRPREKEVNDNDNEGMKAVKKRRKEHKSFNEICSSCNFQSFWIYTCDHC